MSQHTPHVLIVEDDVIVRDTIADFLAEHDIKTVCAVDGISGLQKARLQSFDTIITDINMPRMNGKQFINEVRKLDLHKKTPIIALSAYLDRNVIDEIKHKVSKALVKPLELKSLLDALKKLGK